MEPLEATRLPWAQGVGSSNLPAPTNKIGPSGSASRAPAYQAAASVSLRQLNLQFALSSVSELCQNSPATTRIVGTQIQEVPFAISPGVIADGNGDGQDDPSYQGDRRKMFRVTAVAKRSELRLANPKKSELFVSGRGGFQMSCQATRERSN